MSPTDRRQRHRASLRREILDAASQLFVEEGYRRVTMRRIAARIEYSPTTIYLHFRDKNELFQAVCDETFAQLAAKLERLGRSASDPLAQLREGLKTYVDFGLAHPNQYTVTFLTPNPAPERTPFEGSAGSRAFDWLRQGVLACVGHGDIQTAEAEATAQALWAAVHGLTALLITMPGFPFADPGTLVDHLVDTLIAGLRTPSAAPRAAVAPQSKKWDFFN